jgi:hypothetical protein
MPLQIRRGTNAERSAMTVPLAPGEPLYTTDQGFLYVGNGTTLGGVQVTGYQDENAVDAVGAALINGNNSNITFIYGPEQDVANRIDAVIDLSIYNGDIVADSFKGFILADDSTIVFNSTTNEINVNTINVDNIDADSINSNNLTVTNGIRSDVIGSVFADNSTQLVDAVEGRIVGPVFANVTGNLAGNSTGYHFGDVTGSIFSDGSTKLVDAVEGIIVAPVFADLTGDVYADNGVKVLENGTDGLDAIFTGSVQGNLQSLVGQDVINVSTGTATLNGINIAVGGLIQGDPVFLTNGISIISSNPGINLPAPVLNLGLFTDIPGFSPQLSFARSRGNIISQTSVLTGDAVCSIDFSGFNNNQFLPAAQLIVVVDDDPALTTIPARIELNISDATSSVTSVRFKAKQVEFVATPIVPNLDSTEISTLTPSVGMIVYNTTANKFQGYQNTGGTTLEWVDIS